MASGKNAIVIFVPYRNWRDIAKTKTVIPKLIRELEKKFQKKHVLIVANRTIMDKNFRRKGVAVRTRKRTRVGVDGSKLIKIQLDRKEKEHIEEKLHVFSAVYRTLTNKEAVFGF